MKYYRQHIFVVIALAIVVSSGLHGTLRNALSDLRFTFELRSAGGEIVVVAIDAPSIEQIGVWPWPRRLHADLLRRLDAAGVRDVVFDVDFSSPSDNASDQAFEETLNSVGGSVVLPSFNQPRADHNGRVTQTNRPLKRFADHSWAAVVNVTIEPDGLVRRYPFGEELDWNFVPSMGAVLAGRYARTLAAFLIDFSIRASTIPIVSYVDVLRGDAATLEKLRGRKVIIGATALELGDRFSIPNSGVVSGPLLQILAAESILQDRALHVTSDTVTVVGLLVLALMVMFTSRRLAARTRAIILVGIAAALEFTGFLVQAKLPLILDTSLFHIAIAVYLVAIALDEIDFRGLLRRIAENRFQRIAMSLGDGLVCMDRHHRITVWNPGATAIFGYDAAQMIGRPFQSLCPDQLATAASVALREAAHAPPPLPRGGVIEFQAQRKNGETFPVEACFSSWEGADGIQYGAVLRDITIRKREAEKIRYLAEHDPLTGLANRSTLQKTLMAMMSAATERSEQIALLVIGIDAFQQINDMLGHSCGDRVLCAVAERLSAEAGAAAVIARLSGDEFAIAFPVTNVDQSVAQICDCIALAFNAPLVTGARQHRLKISIGAAVYPEDGRNADELLANSHLAFCRSKADRRSSYVVFANAIRQQLEARLTLETELRLAVERNEFELFYQPQVSLIDGHLIGAEALIRWRHPERGLIPPAEFITIVNTSSISDLIAAWVLETACRQARMWELRGHNVRVGINLSPSQLQWSGLAAAVAEMLKMTGLSPMLLELEVTEDILLLDEARVIETFRQIQELGVRIVLDDFGTGYASLSYLKKFPLDGLKIDKSFVLELVVGSGDAAIVGSIISLGRQLGLSVIAEGIESRASADLLVSMGCEEGQGYYFGRPSSAQVFERAFLLASGTSADEPSAGRAA